MIFRFFFSFSLQWVHFILIVSDR